MRFRPSPIDGLTGTHHVTTIPATGEPVFVIFPPGEDDAIELTARNCGSTSMRCSPCSSEPPIPTRTLEAS